MGLAKLNILFACFLMSTAPLANVITHSNIDQLQILAPSKWQTYNAHQLFDGIDDRYTSTRFVAYQKNGELLSADNPYNIRVMLTGAVAVNSLGFYNDWRHNLHQQVSAMNISLYNSTSDLLWSNDFNQLKQNVWEEIKMFEFSESIADVSRIDFNVFGSQGNHFEIRELLVGFTQRPPLQASAVSVSAPSLALFGMIGISALILWRWVR